MSRGYVVRGTYADGGILTSRYVNLDEAAGYRAERMRWGATEATVYAIADDGTETPLPTYEEALAVVDHARRLTCDDYIDSALAWVDRNRGDNLREMVGIQDAGHIEEMADEIRRLHAERDAAWKGAAQANSEREEALAEIAETHAALDLTVGRRDTADAPPLTLPVRARTAAEIGLDFAKRMEERDAEIERLRGEVDTMRGQRDAFRDHLALAYKNAETERKAWARLYDIATSGLETAGKEAAAHVRAHRALRALGVDVDAVLAEARDVAAHACPDCGEDARNAAHEGME